MKNIVLFAVIIFVLTGCSSLALRPAEFGWPVEVVLKPDAKGTVKESRYQISFNVKALLFDALQDSVNVTEHSLRLIRGQEGLYYLTAKGFKDVYLFTANDGALTLEKKITVSEKGLEAPAFNQKAPFIQLINENNDKEPAVLLSRDGVQGGQKK